MCAVCASGTFLLNAHQHLDALVAELFGCTVRDVRLHLENIYSCGELEPGATRKDFFLVRIEGTDIVALKAMI